MHTIVKCPTCRKAAPWQDNPHRPFCSVRCRTTDLGTWAMESYRIPGQAIEEEEHPSDGDISETEHRSSNKT